MTTTTTWGLEGGEELFRYLDDLYFFKKDRQSRFISANDKFLTLCGVDNLSQLMGKNDHDFFPRSMAERYLRDDAHVMSSRKPLIKILEINAGPDGVRWFQTSKTPLYKGDRVVGLAGVSKDLRRTLHDTKFYDKLKPAIDAIENQPTFNWPMEELAQLTHLSLSQFERTFKKFLGMTPKHYLVTLRLESAQQALETGSQSLASLAIQFGFHDQSHFSQQFKARFGISPLQYRKQCSIREPNA